MIKIRQQRAEMIQLYITLRVFRRFLEVSSLHILNRTDGLFSTLSEIKYWTGKKDFATISKITLKQVHPYAHQGLL